MIGKWLCQIGGLEDSQARIIERLALKVRESQSRELTLEEVQAAIKALNDAKDGQTWVN
jgi:hypothetical protein